jgi:hypothetical protein
VTVLADCHHAETKKGEPEVQRRFAAARSEATRLCPRLTPRLKSSANLNGWKARKTFDDLRRPTRARGSERHAEWDVRKPEMACRCPEQSALAGCTGMSVRRPRTRHIASVNGNRG